MNEKTQVLRSESKLLRPHIIVGKNGLNENTIDKMRDLLKKHRLIKIKVLKTFISDKDKKALAKELAEKTGSQLVDLVGFTVVLAKK